MYFTHSRSDLSLNFYDFGNRGQSECILQLQQGTDIRLNDEL